MKKKFFVSGQGKTTWGYGFYQKKVILDKSQCCGGAGARLGTVNSSVREYFRYLLLAPSVPQGCMQVKNHKVSIDQVYIKVNFEGLILFFFARLYYYNSHFTSLFQNFDIATLRAKTGPAHHFFKVFCQILKIQVHKQVQKKLYTQVFPFC